MLSTSLSVARLLCFFNSLVNGSDEQERRLGKIVVHTLDDLLEASDSLLDGNILALHARELLGYAATAVTGNAVSFSLW